MSLWSFLNDQPRLAKLDREPVEQFGMRGKTTLEAEVVLGLDDPAAEELLPFAVDRDARGERVLFGDEPLREVEARESLARR